MLYSNGIDVIRNGKDKVHASRTVLTVEKRLPLGVKLIS